MDEEFSFRDKFNKGFLSYDEYKNSCYLNFKKPKSFVQMGNEIHKEDLVDDVDTNIQKNEIKLYEMVSENGFVTKSSLRKICDKIGYEIGDYELLEMVQFLKTQEGSDYENFCEILKLL